MKLYEEMNLEAKDLSAKDRKRLRRLKRKAEQDIEEQKNIS